MKKYMKIMSFVIAGIFIFGVVFVPAQTADGEFINPLLLLTQKIRNRNKEIQIEESSEFAGWYDTNYFPPEEPTLATFQNDIGYNVDAGDKLSRSYYVYVGEPVDDKPGHGRMGYLDPQHGDEDDYYMFSVCQGQSISASVTSSENFVTRIFNIEEEELNNGYVAEETSWYFVNIHSDSEADEAEYTFDVTLGGQNDADTGNDAGDTINQATTITPGSYNGYMDHQDTQDWYQFQVSSGQGFRFFISAWENSDFDLFLYNPDGELVYAEEYYGDDELLYPADQTGLWKIKIDMFPGWNYEQWPENYYLYSSGVYDFEFEIGVNAPEPIPPIQQPNVVPIAQTFIVNDDENSLKDEFSYIAAIPAANYHENGAHYVSPILYQGVDDLTNWFGTVDDTTQYLIDDWNDYLDRHDVVAEEIVLNPDPVQAAAEIATSKWSSSDTVIVTVDGSSFTDNIDTVIDRDAQLSSQPEYTNLQADDLQDFAGNPSYPMFIGSKYGAIHLKASGSSFSGDTTIITPRYESVMGDNWPHPYDVDGPDWDTFHPITLPGLWIPFVTSTNGMDEFQIIKYEGDRYTIPISDYASSINVKITTDQPSTLVVYLIDPNGNVRRPTLPHWNGGEILPIHQWNGGHWEHNFDDYRAWIVEPDTEFSVELNHPMEGKWKAIVVPYLSPEGEDIGFSGSYHITAEIRTHNPDRVSASMSAANAAVLASMKHVPLLYVTPDSVPSETSSAISSLGANNIIFVNLEDVSSADLTYNTKYSLTSEIVDAIKAESVSENVITIASFATGEGYFASGAMLAAYHGSPVLNIREAGQAYSILDTLTTWEEYAGEYYHGCRAMGHLPVMDHPFDLTEFIQSILRREFPEAGFDLKLRWYSQVHEDIRTMIEGYGLVGEGKEAYIFVGPRDTDIRDNICRAMNGNLSYAGHIPVEPPAFASALVCRNILYPAVIFANPGRNYTSSVVMNHWEGYDWETNDGATHTNELTRLLKGTFSSHGRIFEGHTLWENLLERYNEGASVIYHCSHGTGGSGICCMYENVEEQFPLAELRHEHLQDFNWWDGWRAYYYDNSRTSSPRIDGRVWFNAQEPNLYDFVHFKWCDQLWENLHSEINLWQSCTTARHFGPEIYLEHGVVLWFGNGNTGRSPQSDMFDSWMFDEFLQKGRPFGEAHTKYFWLHERDFTTLDPTTIYGVSSLNEGDNYGDGHGLANEWVIFGDPTLVCYSPEWTEPVPLVI
jgi:hypothetical protein